MKCQDIQRDELQSVAAQLKDGKGSNTQMQTLLSQTEPCFCDKKGVVWALQALGTAHI